MIPITVFAGKTVAVFGLGASGLLSARALVAGGADVIAFDDSEAKLADAQAAGLTTQNLADIDWSKVAALVLAPGVPLTHPTPHWTVGPRPSRRRRDHRRHRTVLPRARGVGPRLSAGRHHRHQRQVDHHGADHASSQQRRTRRADGRQYRRAGAGAGAVRRRPALRGRSVVLSDRSGASLHATVGILLNVTEDHLDRHGTMENYAAIKTLLAAGVEPGGTAVIGVDDRYTRAAADRIERAGKPVVRVSVLAPLRDGYYAEGTPHHARGRRQGAIRWRNWPASARCAAQHNAQNAAAAVAACVALGLDLPDIQKGLVSFPGLAHRMQQIGAQGQSPLRQRLQGDQCRLRRQGAGELPATFSGSPAASRRPAASTAWPNSSPASARPI